MNDIIRKIDEIYPKLSKAQQKVANYIYYNIKDIIFYPATKLAKKIGVSDTTIIRFCMELNYKGYSDFQEDVKKMMHKEITPYKKLEERTQNTEKNNVYSNVFLKDIENLNKTLNNISNKNNFEILIEKILRAKKIYVLGIRSSAFFAMFLSYALNQIQKKSFSIVPGIGDFQEKLRVISNDDLVIAITFPRYSRDTTIAIKYLIDKGIDVALLTNNNLSVTSLAKIVFTLEIESHSYIDSFTSCMTMINAIIAAVSMKDKTNVKKSLIELEDLFDLFDVFYQS